MGSPTARIFAILFLLLAASAGGFYLLMPMLVERYIVQQVAEDDEVPSILKTEVVYTFSGDKAHLKITVLVPPDHKPGDNNRIFLYGWRGEGEHKVHLDPCTEVPRCKYGFPVTSGEFAPGSRQTVEVDLDRAFVEAKDAHFFLGLGKNDESFYPSDDLLHPRPAAPAKH